jgi:hypothetical protein
VEKVRVMVLMKRPATGCLCSRGFLSSRNLVSSTTAVRHADARREKKQLDDHRGVAGVGTHKVKNTVAECRLPAARDVREFFSHGLLVMRSRDR